ncbi:hypothetical protein HPB48_012970 [Haemaphysalis longicornis]|uniref:Chitin-binding type-2 domain-containing protein n=1 Tax=Haemaphysalis longicornis TaxID=44386 RepID=A0A9J6FRQ2_HAELO|nr:hypothetical protein HPB48_012970 [Haemaphysalis longicornis]
MVRGRAQSNGLGLCEGRPDSLFPDGGGGGGGFVACRAGQAHRLRCPPRQEFRGGHCRRYRADLEAERCSEADGVYTDYGSGCRGFFFCKGGRRTSFSCPGSMLFDWRLGRCRPATRVNCSKLHCDADGVFPDHAGGCRRYFRCSDGEREEMLCPQGQLFEADRCQNSSAVTCKGDDGCGGLPDAFYPAPGCHEFVLCVAGQVREFTCPSDLIFSRKKLACDYPDRGTAFDTATLDCRPAGSVQCLVGADGHDSEPECAGRPDGAYPDPGSTPTSYYACLGEAMVATGSCPDGSAFDPATQHCQAPGRPGLDGVAYGQYECEGRIGVFPDYRSSCRGYRVCADGLEVLHDCDEDLRFDAETWALPAGSSTGCRFWHECVGTEGVSYACPRGQTFDPERMFCRLDISCVDVSPRETGVPSLTGTIKLVNETDSEVDCGYDAEVLPALDRRDFHVCSPGGTYTFRCPTATVFDVDKNTCSVDRGIDATDLMLPGDDFSCEGRNDGLYPDESMAHECARYYVCEGVLTGNEPEIEPARVPEVHRKSEQEIVHEVTADVPPLSDTEYEDDFGVYAVPIAGAVTPSTSKPDGRAEGRPRSEAEVRTSGVPQTEPGNVALSPPEATLAIPVNDQLGIASNNETRTALSLDATTGLVPQEAPETILDRFSQSPPRLQADHNSKGRPGYVPDGSPVIGEGFVPQQRPGEVPHSLAEIDPYVEAQRNKNTESPFTPEKRPPVSSDLAVEKGLNVGPETSQTSAPYAGARHGSTTESGFAPESLPQSTVVYEPEDEPDEAPEGLPQTPQRGSARQPQNTKSTNAPEIEQQVTSDIVSQRGRGESQKIPPYVGARLPANSDTNLPTGTRQEARGDFSPEGGSDVALQRSTETPPYVGARHESRYQTTFAPESGQRVTPPYVGIRDHPRTKTTSAPGKGPQTTSDFSSEYGLGEVSTVAPSLQARRYPKTESQFPQEVGLQDTADFPRDHELDIAAKSYTESQPYVDAQYRRRTKTTLPPEKGQQTTSDFASRIRYTQSSREFARNTNSTICRYTRSSENQDDICATKRAIGCS